MAFLGALARPGRLDPAARGALASTCRNKFARQKTPSHLCRKPRRDALASRHHKKPDKSNT